MTPLVLLPGMNCTEDLWADCDFYGAVAPALEEASVTAQVERLLAALPSTFVLVGLSLGAIIAMELAVRAPERVVGLCISSTNAKAPTAEQRAGWNEWLRRLDAGESPRALQENILTALLSTDAINRRTDLVERTLRMAESTPPERLRAQLHQQSSREDLLQRLPSLRMPVLIVSGTDDTLCPPTFHTEIAHRVPSARLVSLDAGHLLPLERPRDFSDLVARWRELQRI